MCETGVFFPAPSTVVSACSHPGYKLISASAPLGEVSDDFAYSKLSFYRPMGYKNKPSLVPPHNFPNWHIVRVYVDGRTEELAQDGFL